MAALHIPSRRAIAPLIRAACQEEYHQVPLRLFSSSAVNVTQTTNNNNDTKFTRLESLRTQLSQEDSSLDAFATGEPIIKRKKAAPRSSKILPVSILFYYFILQINIMITYII